jgi:CRP-like cAMP-binding protein/nucleotide-binding universal stress UspA family protein
MYLKVLVPLDGSRESEGILALVKGNLTPGGEIILLRVIPPGKSVTVGTHFIMGSLLEEADRREAQRYLQSIARREGRDSATWRVEVVVSRSVAEGIVNFAAWVKADLIAMYTHDRKRLAKMFKGSVAREVQRIGSTEVLVLGPRELAGHTPVTAVAGDSNLESLHFKHVDLFEGLSDEQIEQVVSLGRRLQISSGEILGKGGEQGEDLFVILRGEADLYAHSEIGEIAVRITGPGESFPLAALLGSGTLITSSEALTDMELLAIPRSELLLLCSKDTEIGMRIHSNVAQLLANRYSATLTQLAISAERELRDAEA